MIAKDTPLIVTHGGALAAGNFERLHGRETFENLAYSEPGYQHKGQEQDDATGQNVPASRAAQGQEQGKNSNFRGKTDYPAARSGQEQSDDGKEREDNDGEAAFAPDLAKD